jgi:hypothetical protein
MLLQENDRQLWLFTIVTVKMQPEYGYGADRAHGCSQIHPAEGLARCVHRLRAATATNFDAWRGKLFTMHEHTRAGGGIIC